MKIDIYRSKTDKTKHLSVPSGTKVESLQLPLGIDKDLLNLELHKAQLEMIPSKPRAGIDQADVIAQINRNGYAIHNAYVTTTVSVGGQA